MAIYLKDIEKWLNSPEGRKSIKLYNRVRNKVAKKYHLSQETAGKITEQVSAYNPKDEADAVRIAGYLAKGVQPK